MSTTTEDVITAAASIARDAAEGRLAPTDLEATAVAECRALFGAVAGPGDPLWDLQVGVARQVLSLDGVPADELAEWLAVARLRAGEPLGEPVPADTLPEPETLASEALSPDALDTEFDAVADVEPEPVPAAPPVLSVVTPPPPPRSRDQGYDPLAGWDAGGSRR